MWMMGCNDGSRDQLHSIQDSFNGRKLLPVMPITAAANHGTDHFLALNHHFAMAEQNKREFTRQQVMVSSRWNPTPEQLQALEELYRRGLRTPSAEQIQHITMQLRQYGKIEGKNVFYWFQNHKARERQKRRRQLDQEFLDVDQVSSSGKKKESSTGDGPVVVEVEQTCKKLASPKKSSTTIAQQSILSRKGADGWIRFNEETEIEERSTWQMLHLSYSSPSPNNLINNYSLATHLEKTPLLKHNHLHSGGGCSAAQTTLQLFPASSGCRRPCEEEDQSSHVAVNCRSTTADVADRDHHQFFEFLPLKK